MMHRWRAAWIGCLGWALGAAGCAIHAQKSGIVTEARGKVELLEISGHRTRLAGGEPPGALAALKGLTVDVEGPRLGRRLQVLSWSVRDGGDGSAPFVGPLDRYGSQWRIRDRNSGSVILLDEASMGALKALVGHLVLVTGFVVGPQRIRVVSFRDLGVSE